MLIMARRSFPSGEQLVELRSRRGRRRDRQEGRQTGAASATEWRGRAGADHWHRDGKRRGWGQRLGEADDPHAVLEGELPTLPLMGANRSASRALQAEDDPHRADQPRVSGGGLDLVLEARLGIRDQGWQMMGTSPCGLSSPASPVLKIDSVQSKRCSRGRPVE